MEYSLAEILKNAPKLTLADAKDFIPNPTKPDERAGIIPDGLLLPPIDEVDEMLATRGLSFGKNHQQQEESKIKVTTRKGFIDSCKDGKVENYK